MNKIYSAELVSGVAVGVTLTQALIIPANINGVIIRSIFWSLCIVDAVGVQLNLSTQATQRYQLRVGLGLQITEIFTPSLVDVPAINQNGDAVVLHKPGQTHFNGFKIYGDVNFAYVCTNYDALLGYTHIFDLLVETEEL